MLKSKYIKTYKVSVPVIYQACYLVQATSPEEAKKLYNMNLNTMNPIEPDKIEKCGSVTQTGFSFEMPAILYSFIDEVNDV